MEYKQHIRIQIIWLRSCAHVGNLEILIMWLNTVRTMVASFTFNTLQFCKF